MSRTHEDEACEHLAYIASRAHAAMAKLRGGDRKFAREALNDIRTRRDRAIDSIIDADLRDARAALEAANG